MDWSQKPSIATYFLRCGMGGVPITGYNMSPEVRDGVKLKKEVGVSSLQNLMGLYSQISEDYRAKSNPKKAVSTLRRALSEVDLRAAKAPESGTEQKKGVHVAEDATLGRVKLNLQLCATFSRQGQHIDALNAAQKGLEDVEQLWKDVCKNADIRVEEISVVDLFSNSLNVEEMLLKYNLNWLEQAVCVTVQAKHCAAIELEFENDLLAPDEDMAKAWERIISLHEEGAKLAKEVLLPTHATLRLAEDTLSKAKERRDAAVPRAPGIIDDPFCIRKGDKADLDNVEQGKGAAGDGTDGLTSQEVSRQDSRKKKESLGSPSEKRRRKKPIRSSPLINLNHKAPVKKNPFQDYGDDELTLDAMRRHILLRNDTCVRDCHLDLKRRKARFQEWMTSTDHDDLFQLRTTFSDAGLISMRRMERKKALSEGRPVSEDIDVGGLVKSVKGFKKNLMNSNTYLCKRAGVEQEDPNEHKGLTLLASAFRGEKPPEEKRSSKTLSSTMSFGGTFSNFGMSKTRRSSQDPFATM